MTGELLTAIIAAIAGAVSGGIVNVLLEMRKERREDKKEKEREKRTVYDNRPELKIEDYKCYIKRPGYGVKKEYDINIFLTKIESVSVQEGTVKANYNETYFNEEEWCCVIYTFKNVGKTDIQCINPICTYKKDTVLCSVGFARHILEYGMLNYSICYDKKLRVGESLTMKVCYHKDCIVAGMLSANMSMGLEDSNNRCWLQPLFAPDDKIYDAIEVSYKEYRDNLTPDSAIECFEKPWMW